jgi:hypothetical protein
VKQICEGENVKALRAVVLGLCCLFAGCFLFAYEEPPSNKQLYGMYKQTTLRQSTSAEILARFAEIETPKYALLSQSKSVVAVYGEKKSGEKLWFNIVAFDENELVARRKYVMIYDERPKQLFVRPWEGTDFGCQIVLPKDILDEPYADENARRIAILRQVEADLRKDTAEVGVDNKMISGCGMMLGQTMSDLLIRLDASPALAGRFGEPNGLNFEQRSALDKGRLRMVVDNDIVTIRMQLGSFMQRGKLGFDGFCAMED